MRSARFQVKLCEAMIEIKIPVVEYPRSGVSAQNEKCLHSDGAIEWPKMGKYN